MERAHARGWGHRGAQEGSPGGRAAGGPGPRSGPPPGSSCSRRRRGARRKRRRRKGTAAAARALTEWFTPHIRTLSSGSLARKSFTFCATKCFFLVLVLLASTEDPRLPGVAMAAACPLHRRSPRPGTRPLYSPARGGSRIPPAAAPARRVPLRPPPRSALLGPLGPLGRAGKGGCALLAPRPGSCARRGSALSPRLDQARRERLPRWAPAS